LSPASEVYPVEQEQL
jgi:wobble nucleotide-excising tRNase